jgi:hypothetical protein
VFPTLADYFFILGIAPSYWGKLRSCCAFWADSVQNISSKKRVKGQIRLH